MSIIMIIEKDAEWQQVLSGALEEDYDISFCNHTQVKASIKGNKHSLIVLDLLSVPSGVFQLLGWFKSNVPDIPILLTSQTETTELVVKTIKLGAYDFVVKPYSAARLRHVVHQALTERTYKNEIDYLRHEQDVIYNFDHVVAATSVMRDVLNTLRKFAQTDGTILMTGETGTGKSFLSGTVHFNSHRKERPFVKVNCANIPETLLESELFGHEKGAFTGADKQRIGRFEQAHGGSLFLDEIGEMSLSLQAKLLRVLEDKSFERVGGNQTIRSNVRVIAATNRNLKSMILSGGFREDLFYRINVLAVKLPPLRERPLCIEPLAQSLLIKISRSLGKKITGLSASALRSIQISPWPGNIRQLANTIERAAILTESSIIDEDSLPVSESATEIIPSLPTLSAPSTGFSLATQEKEFIVKVLEDCLWIQKDAAQFLGISPRALNYKVKKLGISHPRWRKNKG